MKMYRLKRNEEYKILECLKIISILVKAFVYIFKTLPLNLRTKQSVLRCFNQAGRCRAFFRLEELLITTL